MTLGVVWGTVGVMTPEMMNADYLWGLLTLPAGLLALGLCAAAIKGGYLLLGLLGKVGIARFGASRPDSRYTLGAVVASASRITVLNKGTTGVVFFTGRAEPANAGHIARLTSALRAADNAEPGIDVAELINRSSS